VSEERVSEKPLATVSVQLPDGSLLYASAWAENVSIYRRVPSKPTEGSDTPQYVVTVGNYWRLPNNVVDAVKEKLPGLLTSLTEKLVTESVVAKILQDWEIGEENPHTKLYEKHPDCQLVNMTVESMLQRGQLEICRTDWRQLNNPVLILRRIK